METVRLQEKVCPFMSGFGTESFNDDCPNVLIKKYDEVMCKRDLCAVWIAGEVDGDGRCGMIK